jgi:hypothetical protein
MKDFFQYPEEIPAEVQAILDTLDEDCISYYDLNRVTMELNNIGWTMDYGLDASPYGLKPLN